MKMFSRLFRQAPPPPPPVLEAGPRHDDRARSASIAEMPDGHELRQLAGFVARDSNAAAVPQAVARAAQARLAQLVDAGSITFAELCAPADFPRLVLESGARLRQMAAAGIDDPTQLRSLLKQVRHKDKVVYKILKQKVDALNAADRESQRRQSDVNALCASLVRHSERTYDAFYESTFARLSGQWQAHAGQPDVAQVREVAQAIERCRDVIAAHAQEAAAKAARAADVLAQQEAALESRRRLEHAAREAAAAQAQAEDEQRRHAAAVREAEEKERADQRAVQDQVWRQLAGLIRKANDALRDGNTQKAAGLRRALAERAPAAALPASIVRQLQHLDDQLNELKRWKDYAVAPKRIELIEEMESLIGSAEEPRVLAERIKTLQEDWRTISKGIVSDAADEWERFHRAAQTAYQPCREYFEAQATLREANLARRRTLLERIAAVEVAQGGEHPEWPLLAQVLREAPREWRGYSPVDREAGKALQREFDAAMTRLQAQLDAWHERNVADRQALIERARVLAAQDGRDTIEAVKRLQALWKAAGPVPRDRDQPLWNEFREFCDAVYQKRQQAFADYTAALEAAKAEAVALCEAAERAAALTGTALLDSAATIPEWRRAFDALGEMPRADARAIASRFERALAACRAHVTEQRIRDAERAVDNLFEAARHLDAHERAAASAADPVETESLRRTAEGFIAGIEEWPKGTLTAVRERLAAPASPFSMAAREKALRTLCIRCEILSDAATPAEDEALRREYQVQRLVQGMGQGNRPDEGDWDAMLCEWIRIGAVTAEVQARLLDRFSSLVRRHNSIGLRGAQFLT